MQKLVEATKILQSAVFFIKKKNRCKKASAKLVPHLRLIENKRNFVVNFAVLLKLLH